MKINIGIVATAAAKKPSTKAVQKAQSVLKNASKAKVDVVKEKLQAAIGEALALDKEAKNNGAVAAAQVSKLEGQIDRINTKAETAYLKMSGKITKIVDRVSKLQDEYHLLGGKDIVPDSLKEYFTKERPAKTLGDKTSKKKAKRPASK